MAEYDADKAGAREDLCRFLAACYYEPDAAFAEERLFESMLAAAERIDPGLAQCAGRLGAAFASDLESLLVDYARLFLGPPEALAKPYGSFWLSGESTLMQDSTMTVLQLYQEAGFDIGDEFMEAPDHVAVELEFLYLIAFRQNEAQRAGLADVRSNWEDLERVLLGEHLGKWIGPFAAAVKARAQTDFYRELAELTERFVRMESALLAPH
jgi:putative dimethyl sulfoxide reductase chaperone